MSSEDEERPAPPRRLNLRGALGTLFTGGLLLSKLKGLLVVAKLLPLLKTFGWIAVYLVVETIAYGWLSAVLFLLILLLHECGHAFALKLQKRPVGAMVFIPFLGGAVAGRSQNMTLREGAFVAILGPAAGTLGVVVCTALFFGTGHPLWLFMAFLGSFLNLFQLAPAPMLDGGRIALLFSPKLLMLGIPMMLVAGWRSPLVWLFALLSLPQAWAMWRADPQSLPTADEITPQVRLRYGIAFVALLVALSLTMSWAQDELNVLRRMAATLPS